MWSVCCTFVLTRVLRARVCVALVVSAQACVSVEAVQSDQEASDEMLAGRLTVSQRDGAAGFEGNVVIAQGDMRLSAVLVARTQREAGGSARLSASGTVLLMSPPVSAPADSPAYDLSGRYLHTRGAALLHQCTVSLSSALLKLHL